MASSWLYLTIGITFVGLIGAVVIVTFSSWFSEETYAICCTPWNMNGYIDPDSGLFVGIGELQNDHIFWQPLTNITFTFQFLDEHKNLIYEKQQSISHTLPINSGFLIPPLAKLPFKVVLDDPIFSKKTKYFTEGGPVHIDRSDKWKPADLVVSFNKIDIVDSKPNLGYKKWVIEGTILNSYKKSTNNVYVVAGIYDKNDRIIGVAGYSPNEKQPIQLDGLQAKNFILYATIPDEFEPDHVYLYAESEESSMKYPYYKPVIVNEHNVNGKPDHTPTNLIVGASAKLNTKITNISRDYMDFYWIIKITKLEDRDEWTLHPELANEGFTERIDVIPDFITGLNSTRFTYSWIPPEEGTYVYEIYIWSNMENPEPLSWPIKQSFLNDNRIFVN